MNNPWTGARPTGAPPVLIPLNTLSSSNGTDLEIKIEWDTTSGTTPSRFYKGWRLNEVFDYTLANDGNYTDGVSHSVSAKKAENDSYTTATIQIRHANHNWNWTFHPGGSNDTMGYNNLGLLIHGEGSVGDSTNDTISRLYAGTDSIGGSYGGVGSGRTGFTKLRVYVKKSTVSIGSAYIFARSGTTWSQQAKLLASDASGNDNFGSGVAISGDYAIIGSYGNDDGGSESGSAYIFARSGTTWTQQAKLLASDASGNDYFGYVVAISANCAIVGSYGNDLIDITAHISVGNMTSYRNSQYYNNIYKISVTGASSGSV